MSKTLILHLGSYKTGSSSIQNLLFSNIDKLAEYGILYPQSGLDRSDVIGSRHRNLITPVVQGNTSSYVTHDLRKELETAERQTVIISSEAWSNPRFQAMLGGFAAELADLGFDEIIGVVFLRNLTDYKVSFYRQQTYRGKNKVPFHGFMLQTPGIYDYLFLIRSLRSIFGSRLHIIDYSHIDDSIEAFFGAIGLSSLLPELYPVERSNVRSVGALDVEIKRQANRAGLPQKKAINFIRHVETRHPDMFRQHWTERKKSEDFVYGSRYRKDLADITGWSAEAVDRVLEDRPLNGRRVSEADTLIAEELKLWSGRHKSTP